MKIRLILSLFSLLISPFSLFAQGIKDAPTINESLGLGQRFVKELAVPFTTDAKYILGGALISAGMVYINKGRRTYNKRETFDDAKPFGDYGYVGDILGWGFLNGIYTIGHFINGVYGEDEASLKASEHMFKASLYTLMVTASLKTVIQERRPGYPEDRSSFPSGHSSMSFAFASVVAARHGWAYGSLAYGVASYISISRINDDWHYLHDVLTGMGIGAAYGWGLMYAYESGLPFQFTIIPLPKGGNVSLSYQF